MTLESGMLLLSLFVLALVVTTVVVLTILVRASEEKTNEEVAKNSTVSTPVTVIDYNKERAADRLKHQ